MKATIRTLAVAVTLGTLGLGAAMAQTSTTTAGAGANPAARGAHSTFYGPLSQPQGQLFSNSLGNNLIKRPKGNGAGAVTPVPEPSQWAMMLAGLALVGFIAKRRHNAR